MGVSTRAGWRNDVDVDTEAAQNGDTQTNRTHRRKSVDSINSDLSLSSLSNLSDDEDAQMHSDAGGDDQASIAEKTIDSQPGSFAVPKEIRSEDVGIGDEVPADINEGESTGSGIATWQDFVGGFSLSPGADGPSSVTTNAGEGNVIAASLFTPMGSRITYFSNVLNWNRFQPDTNEFAGVTTEESIVQSLYLNASYANRRSVMLLEDPKRRTVQFKKMFSATPDPKQAEYSHVQLQVALLDRFVWCRLPLSTTHNRRLTSVGSIDDLPEHIQSLYNSCKQWQPTLASAAAHFLVHERIEADPAMIKAGDPADPSTAVESLGYRFAQSKNKVHVNHIEQNFIAAAIGLRALAEVRSWSTRFSNVCELTGIVCH